MKSQKRRGRGKLIMVGGGPRKGSRSAETEPWNSIDVTDQVLSEAYFDSSFGQQREAERTDKNELRQKLETLDRVLAEKSERAAARYLGIGREDVRKIKRAIGEIDAAVAREQALRVLGYVQEQEPTPEVAVPKTDFQPTVKSISPVSVDKRSPQLKKSQDGGLQFTDVMEATKNLQIVYVPKAKCHGIVLRVRPDSEIIDVLLVHSDEDLELAAVLRPPNPALDLLGEQKAPQNFDS
jgi:hypothetical protein